WFGAYMNSSHVFTFFKNKIFGKFEEQFNKFGGFLVIVAALTPLPFSGICMLVGSTRYPFKRFLLFSLARVVRFTVYAYIIWQAHVA
ncbi:MAG: VTT domain-containing protein, partial [Cyclobacteriaceae bacterium]